MQVTCIHCGLEAVITPDFHQCRHCHGSLESLVTPDFKANYFFQKARESAEHGSVYIALEQIQKGLQAQNRSDLHLLAAILYADLGREEQLRMHIGAIPTDDVLRVEAESLLKQLVARRQRESLDADRQAVPDRQASVETGTSSSSVGPRLVASILTATVVLVTVSLLARMQGTDVALMGGLSDRVAQWRADFTDAWTAAGEPVESAEVLEPTAVASALRPASGPEARALDTKAPMPSADGHVPIPPESQSLAPAGLSPEQWHQQVTQGVLDLIALEAIDFTRILVDHGFSDLQEARIVGVVQGPQLILMGSVPSAAARQKVIDFVSSLRGVMEVDAFALEAPVPEPSYVVRPGDSLWSIAQEHLGDGARWPELVQLNPELENSALHAGKAILIPVAVQASNTAP